MQPSKWHYSKAAIAVLQDVWIVETKTQTLEEKQKIKNESYIRKLKMIFLS